MKILLLIISSQEEPYRSFEKLCRYYIFSHSNIDSYFIEFSSQINDNYQISNSKIIFKGQESVIPGCYEKTKLALKYLFNTNYDYVVRTNLSTLIDLNSLFAHLENSPREKYYAGFKASYKNRIPFCSGALFILSKDIAEFLNSHTIFKQNTPDDVYIGEIINNKFGDIRKHLNRQIITDSKTPLNKRVCQYRFKTSNRLEDINNYVNYLKQIYPGLYQVGVEFFKAKETKSDINEHIQTLYEYTKECDSVVECGVRNVVSSWAFVKGLIDGGKGTNLTSCDLKFTSNINKLKKLSKDCNIDFEFLEGNDILLDLNDADLYFIDTWHVYGHLKRELEKFYRRARKYIIMHDTTIDGEKGESIRCKWNIPKQSKESGYSEEEIRKGLKPAINEFLENHPEWKVEKEYVNNNGLTILKRIN